MRISFKRQALLNTFGNVASLFCQWLIVLLLPRMGGFTEAGVFSLAISVASIFNVVAVFNTRSYQVANGYVSESEGGFLSARLVTTAFSFAACISYLLLSGYDLVRSFCIIAYLLYRNLLSLTDIYAGSLQIKERLDLAGIGALGEGLVSAATFLISYLLIGKLLASVMLMAFFGGLFYTTFILYFRKKISGWKVESPKPFKTAFTILKKCFPLFLAAIFPIILNALPKIMLQKHSGDETVGLFSSLSAPTLAITTAATGLMAPLIIRFSALAKAGDQRLFRRKFYFTLYVLLISGAALFGLAALLGPWFFSALYGEGIMSSINVFYYLVLTAIIYSAASYSATVLVTLGKLPFTATASITGLTVGTVFFAVLIPSYEMKGAAWGLTAAYLVQTVVQLAGIVTFTKGVKKI